MNLQELILSVVSALQTMKDAWLVKLVASFFVAVLASTPSKLLGLFVILVFFDLFTRWLALSKKHLEDKGVEQISLLSCLVNMKKAREAGYIQSAPMKHRFAGKFIWYSLMCLVAATLDIQLGTLNQPQYFVKLFIAYMGASEAMSILENCQEAGVDQASGLLELIRQKRGGK